MTAFKKTRGLLFGLLKMRHGALSNGSHVYCHKIIFYLHLLLWSITCQQLQKKLINFDIYFVIFWHWSFEERTYVVIITNLLNLNGFDLLFALINLIVEILRWPFIIGVPLSNVAELFLGNRKKGKGKEKKLVGKTKKDDYFQENAYTSHLTL